MRAPWYAFLYRWLGAHGTFWLWIVAIAAAWWSWRGALVSVLDRTPDLRAVSEVADRDDLHRWVELPGVRLDLAPEVLSRDEALPVVPTILIDQDDPAATFWARTREVADLAALGAPARVRTAGAALGETAAVAAMAARRAARDELVSRRTAIRHDPIAHLPRPRASLVLQYDGAAPPVSMTPASAAPAPASNDAIAEFEQSVTTWCEAVRSHVESARPAGLVTEVPRTLADEVERELGLRLGRRALRVGRRPSETNLYVFCSAALVLVFLAAGFYGVGRSERTTSAAGSP